LIEKEKLSDGNRALTSELEKVKAEAGKVQKEFVAMSSKMEDVVKEAQTGFM